MYLSSIGPVPLLLFLLSALHEIRNPCRQSEVVRIISGLLLLLFATGLRPGLALRPGAPEAALAAVDAVVAGRQLWRTVSGAGPDTGAWSMLSRLSPLLTCSWCCRCPRSQRSRCPPRCTGPRRCSRPRGPGEPDCPEDHCVLKLRGPLSLTSFR